LLVHMDPIKLIKQDHRTVKSLFRAFERSDRRAEKQRIAEEIIEELSVHSTIEEQLVYPILREAESRHEGRVLNALEEHHAAKLILAELDKMTADEERFDAKMHVVREAVEMHIEEEESTLLPRLDKLLDDDMRSTLAEALVAAKEAAPDHPHPGAPDTPPAGKIAGLFAKVTDSGKNIVRKVTNQQKAAGHRRVTRRAEATAGKVTRRKKTAARGAARARPRKSPRRAQRGRRRRRRK
jgi:hemerythrin superfamily protein